MFIEFLLFSFAKFRDYIFKQKLFILSLQPSGNKKQLFY